jgi:hypothetical protein
MKLEQGYVYILTNPSFKEDWVKIGKSARPVDVRSKKNMDYTELAYIPAPSMAKLFYSFKRSSNILT